MNALMQLQPLNLIAAGQATSFQAMMAVLAGGGGNVPNLPAQSLAPTPNALGDVFDDLVFTPVAPCRIADTRVAGGPIAGGTHRDFDVDGSNLSAQGGSSTGCGIPLGVAQAVLVTISTLKPTANGYFTAWRYLSAQPLAYSLLFTAANASANSTIVAIYPGGGSDMSLYSAVTADAILDVSGYFAAPGSSALPCTTVVTPVTTVGGGWVSTDVTCPVGTTVTGGGSDTGLANIFMTSIPNLSNGWRTWSYNATGSNQGVVTYAVCCSIPGR
jgi:hypothetical protein